MMAYLDPTALYGLAPRARAAQQPAPARPTGGFSALEWTVIALARRDGPESLRAPGRIARAFGSLFGLGVRTGLADPRLEALRRMAIHAWRHGYALPLSELQRFEEAGFSADQAEALLASVGGARGRRGLTAPAAALAG